MKMLKEEKELRKWIRAWILVPSVSKDAPPLITALIRAVRADEREKCAKVAEDVDLHGQWKVWEVVNACAAAIRGRK